MAKDNTLRPFSPKVVLRFFLMLLFPAALFVSAGRLNWVMAWVYVVTMLTFSLGSRLLAARKNPDLLVERARSLDAPDVKSWDRVLVPWVAMYGPLAVWVVCGLDERFGWSLVVPAAWQWVALGVAVLGMAFSTWAMLENKFFSAAVRIQKDRHQTVVSTGPYRFVRHPGYAGGLVTYLATPFVLDAMWGLIPVVLVITGMFIRTWLEDRTLQEELEGYKDYTQRVRHRLVPGIW